MAISVELAAWYERVRYSHAKSVAQSIQFACGSNRRLMADLLDDLNRAALFNEIAGNESVRLKLRQVRVELGLGLAS